LFSCLGIYKYNVGYNICNYWNWFGFAGRRTDVLLDLAAMVASLYVILNFASFDKVAKCSKPHIDGWRIP
jgi:hypothetical protein